MTLETFLRKLKKMPRAWKLNADGRIRCHTLCPVESLAGVPHGLLGEAQKKLGLSDVVLNEIVLAADRADAPLRARLLRACGLLSVALVLLAGCAGIREPKYTTMAPAADALPVGRCTIREVVPSASVLGAIWMCFDVAGNIVGVGGFQGQAYITTGMQALGAAASVAGPGAGAAILGAKFVEGAKAMPRTITTTGAVTTSGSVSVTVPPVSVAPVQILGPVAP